MSKEISRRNIIKRIPLLAGGALLSQSLLSSAMAAPSSALPAATRKGAFIDAGASLDKSLISYYQVPMQKRLKINEKGIQGKPYAEFFDSNLDAPVEMIRALEQGPLAKEHILQPTKAGLKTLLERFDEFPVSGYAVVEDGGPCAYAQSRHIFPGVTTEMFKWWFCWHPIESERYYLWFPHAHIHNSVVDPKRLADTRLSYAERLYGNPNHITEYIGDNYLDGVIHFNAPESFGVESELLKKHRFTFNASGIITPYDAQSTPLVLMIHLGRDTPQGMEMVNRYWIGTHESWDRFDKFPDGGKRSREYIAKAGMTKASLEGFAYEMAVHDMTEFSSLGRFLPEIYARFGNS
ncbi:DAPG hydrolase family protein [Serratia marcescens]|uniref:DAPG hydrolase family protein n=1 Tax=Serratia marcescens TaxID=615 RepID=UPI000667A062|nr:hypothetical protein [Serratia marcescens]WEE02672.1 2,4-diacetylphloroglucinol hydrolase [Serratia marcescens]